MNIKKLIIFFSLVVSFGFFTGKANAECGKITIADMNWASASLMANVDKVILETGYGC